MSFIITWLSTNQKQEKESQDLLIIPKNNNNLPEYNKEWINSMI